MDIQGYGWAQNRSKLERAVNEAKGNKGDKYSEEDVKVIYRRLLGFVIGEDIARPSKMDSLSADELFDLAEKKKKIEKKKAGEEKAEEKKIEKEVKK